MDKTLSKDYYLLQVLSLKTEDTLYCLSKTDSLENYKTSYWTKIKSELIFNSNIFLVDSIKQLSSYTYRSHYPLSLYSSNGGQLILQTDTFVVKVFMSKDINDEYIRSENIGCN